MLGLYVHIPFCSSICNYCNFNRGLYDADLKTRYSRRCCRRSRRRSPPISPPTRSSSAAGHRRCSTLRKSRRIIQRAANVHRLDAAAEVTLETNPETVDARKLEGFRAAGVNRLSFGVQSFSDEELRRLGRIHSADRARLAVQEARAAGFANVSLDLMMWLPGQSCGRLAARTSTR